jgi:anaerobic dimethyl sulfoxide reductase subunit C (anchor subunit)
MNLRELSLVAFTLLMQASVGTVLVLGALPFVPGSHLRGGAWPGGRLETPLLVASAAAVLGLLASLFHLGQPLQAWLALGNVRGSWLSREIVLAVAFVAALAVVTLMPVAGRGGTRQAAALCAGVAGVALVFAMSRLYMVPGQPAWDRLDTPIAFFTSTLLLGLVMTLAFGGPALDAGAGRWLGIAAVPLLVLQVILVLVLFAAAPVEPAAAISRAGSGSLALWLVAGRIAAAVGGALLLAVVLRDVPVPVWVRQAAFALVIVSEIFGRAVFYTASARLGPI